MKLGAALALYLALALVQSGCPSQQGKPMKQNPTDTQTPSADVGNLDELAKELGIPLPPDTTVLALERQSGIDDMVRAKLGMSRRAFETIAAQLPLKREDLRPGAGRLGTDHGSWNPHATPGLRSGQAALEGARYLNLGIAEDGPERMVLFVVNHGT